jgi:hypothetical protein
MAKTQAPEADKGTEVVTNMEIVDNTDVVVVEEKAVETESYELLGGLTQVNYL